MKGDELSSDKLHVVIVDDHTLLSDGLATILSAEVDIEVVGQGGTAQDAIRLAHDLLPEIILLDIDVPGNGVEAARVIANDYPVTKIVILTASEEGDRLISTLKIGARLHPERNRRSRAAANFTCRRARGELRPTSFSRQSAVRNESIWYAFP